MLLLPLAACLGFLLVGLFFCAIGFLYEYITKIL